MRLGDAVLELRHVAVHPVDPEERAMVFATWIRSYKDVATGAGVCPSTYFLEQDRVISRLFSLTHIAFRAEAPSVIHGWVCGRPGVLHYAYVRPDIRRCGLARQMVDEVCGGSLDYTHRWPYKPPAMWSFNPYLAGVMP